jgi:hypothetical protein
MAFEKSALYLIPFELPDGPHIAAGYGSENAEKAGRQFAPAILQNPEAKYDPTKIRRATHEEIEQAARELREQDPSRPLATDLGLDSPARVLTNPEVVPGSQFVPAPKTLGDQ